MRFLETAVAGCFVVEPEPVHDERGFFARVFCEREFGEMGLETRFVQHSISSSKQRGTVRGLHLQRAPFEEAKLVRCTRGSMYDVAVDLRPGSATHLAHAAARLTADDHRMLYIPKGCAHGFQTLDDDTEVEYLISEFYAPDHQQSVRWDDPVLGIEWPVEVSVISDRDAAAPRIGDT